MTYLSALAALLLPARSAKTPRSGPRFHVPLQSPGTLTVRQLIEIYRKYHPSLKRTTFYSYISELNKFEKWKGRPIKVTELSDDLLTDYLEHLVKTGPAATAKKAYNTLMALWRFAYRKRLCENSPRDVPLIAVPKSIPQAWTPDQIYRILDACDSVAPLDGWDGRHWKALVLAIYDTSARISALLQTKASQFDPDRGLLRTAAEHQKQNAEQLHQLHAETTAALLATFDGPRELLFPWPLNKERIWPHFKKILAVAELPTTRRDMFHKIRRTSYTLTYALLGPHAATEHAGHSADLSQHYLDPDLLRRFSNVQAPTDVMPRPSGPQLRVFEPPGKSEVG